MNASAGSCGVPLNVWRRPAALRAALLGAALARLDLPAAVPVDLSGMKSGAEVRATASDDALLIDWPAGHGTTARVEFSLREGTPLLKSLALARGAAGREIAHNLDPYFELNVGQRDLSRNGWMVFFDRVNDRPTSRHPLRLAARSARAEAAGQRGRVEFSGLAGGGFSGRLAVTFYAGSPLLQVEAIVGTAAPSRAILYDAGLHFARSEDASRYAWADASDNLVVTPASVVAGVPRAVKYRTIVAQTATGALAVFPPPHRFLYPLDFADNFGCNFAGRDYDPDVKGQAFGVRQPPDGDQRFVPWVNAPPGTEQRLGFFLLLSDRPPDETLEAAKRYTHGDRFIPLPGHKTFTSHYHVEHTMEVLDARRETGSTTLPARLQLPGFVRAFRSAGVDIVHLGEFHFSWAPGLDAAGRLEQLQAMHDECARLSTDGFLLLPGEEPNVHLGGHWMSLFPQPVYWVLNRPAGTPFRQTMADGRTLYHVGSPDDVLELMQREHGLMWTAHARIKGSTGFPERYRDTAFFRSDRFLGAAWKAMPADYSRDRLGERVLDLFDDLANGSPPKQVLGEVDVFRIEPDSELYGHMNINYLEMDTLPRFQDGWTPVLDALRAGRFFVTTGEVLLSAFQARATGGRLALTARLQWTFPLAFAEFVTGDGAKVTRQRVDLSDTREFGSRDFALEVPAAGARWVRLEAWDVAGNGAFTQPKWLE